jgi:tetratricopeptide (TPR) repeat protein
MAFVEHDLRESHRVPRAQRQRVATEWSRQRVDPELVGHLVAWLATGRNEFLAGAGARWEHLLRARVDVTQFDVASSVSVAMDSVRENLVRAQRDDRDAIRAAGESVKDLVMLTSGDVRGHITREVDRVSQLARAQRPAVGRTRFNLPAVAASFAGRRQELDELDAALARCDHAIITQAICGLGGVGKSQLAARYVQKCTDAYDVVAWIRAEDGGVADLARFAAKLGQPVDGLPPGEAAQLALDWLSDSAERWLLVLDNVASAEQLDALRPWSGSGRVLVTSRDRALDQFGPVLTLDVFDEDTATRYLTSRAARPAETAAARKLARALGCLPLALAHAGAYCQSGTSFADYHALLEGLPVRDFFDSNPELSYAQTVASTWKVSIDAARGVAPLAGDVLEMAAHLAPDAIPKSLFGVIIEPDTARERKRLADAINALARFSLVTVDDDTVGVHRLLQKVVRDDVAGRDNRVAALRARDAVAAAFPSDVDLPACWPLCERLVPHVLALADSVPVPGNSATQLVDLLNETWWYLTYVGAHRRQRLALAQRAFAHSQGLPDAEHFIVLRTRNIVALSDYRSDSGGDAESPVALFEVLITDAEGILGPEHPFTLGVRGNLGLVYRDAGRFEDALAVFEPLLAGYERILGSDHLGTLLTRGNLAKAYQDAGRIDEALTILEPLLADRERILGPKHPNTLDTRDMLAGAHQDAGRIDQALTILEPLLADRERILGAKHADTLATRASLAGAYDAAGRTADAERVRTAAPPAQSSQ